MGRCHVRRERLKVEQVVSRLPGGEGLAVSGSVELEQGARGALILIDELFRLDVCPHGDTLRVVTRPLAGTEVALAGSGYSGAVVACSERLDRLASLSPARFDVTVELRRDDLAATAPVLIGALHIADRGTTRLTAQTVVTGALVDLAAGEFLNQ
jgi:hypothetical protein